MAFLTLFNSQLTAGELRGSASTTFTPKMSGVRVSHRPPYFPRIQRDCRILPLPERDWAVGLAPQNRWPPAASRFRSHPSEKRGAPTARPRTRSIQTCLLEMLASGSARAPDRLTRTTEKTRPGATRVPSRQRTHWLEPIPEQHAQVRCLRSRQTTHSRRPGQRPARLSHNQCSCPP